MYVMDDYYKKDAEMVRALFEEARKSKNAKATIEWGAGSFSARAEIVVLNDKVVRQHVSPDVLERYTVKENEQLKILPPSEERAKSSWAKHTAYAMVFTTWGLCLGWIAQTLFWSHS